jgi:hypothetical protein
VLPARATNFFSHNFIQEIERREVARRKNNRFLKARKSDLAFQEVKY